MKYFLCFCAFFFFCFSAKADHITGGEMFYTYNGFSNGSHHYSVTLKFYMRCNSGRQFNNPTIIVVYDKLTGNQITTLNAPLVNQENTSLDNSNPCITDPPPVCYEIGYYSFSLSLPPSQNGYIISSLVNYRINGINNLISGYSQVGATYIAEIPVGANANNTSARFIGSDLVVVCADNSFNYSFAATDDDGDQLRYRFCGAYQSGTTGTNSAPLPPPYTPVPYGQGFSESAPLGQNVRIDPNTGLITGIAPAAGVYVVTVCVDEIRNGIVIATQRKDLQINVASCTIAAASLLPEYMLCRDTKTINLTNRSTSPLIKTYDWEISTTNGIVLHTSTNPTVDYTFADTGIYKIKLVINRGDNCSDSTTSLARVYPGFIPGFTFTGLCVNKPTSFTNTSTSIYGIVNSWTWEFGESTSEAPVPTANTNYTYTTSGDKNVILTVTNTKGCKDTAQRILPIVDKPPLGLLFRDSLICVNDMIRLNATALGGGNFSWTPSANMMNANTASPTVSPAKTTVYYVNLDDNGCINRDSVTVNVTDHVDLVAMNDTTICAGDTIKLHVASNGFQYSWTPAASLDDPSSPNPFAKTNTTITYNVTARIGGCLANDNVIVNTVPYPVVNAGTDTTICYDSPVQLNGSTDGSLITWSPATGLSNRNIVDPIAKPKSSTKYLLSVRDTKGCPKPSVDTVVINVLPEIMAYAGNDTSVIAGQELQLNASGGVKYQWQPSLGLSATNISNPVAIYNDETDKVVYKILVYDDGGCVDSTLLTVKIFKTAPTVFVPTAFTPNGDGINDYLRPIAAGIGRIDYFRVYNRWGRLVFSTTVNGQGWDGKIAGNEQGTGVFVWQVKAVDYRGIAYFKTGLVTLIK